MFGVKSAVYLHYVPRNVSLKHWSTSKHGGNEQQIDRSTDILSLTNRNKITFTLKFNIHTRNIHIEKQKLNETPYNHKGYKSLIHLPFSGFTHGLFEYSSRSRVPLSDVTFLLLTCIIVYVSCRFIAT